MVIDDLSLLTPRVMLPLDQIGDGRVEGEVERLTFLHSFVLFLALAIAFPSLTNTQPTGTSSAVNASSAWWLEWGH